MGEFAIRLFARAVDKYNIAIWLKRRGEPQTVQREAGKITESFYGRASNLAPPTPPSAFTTEKRVKTENL